MGGESDDRRGHAGSSRLSDRTPIKGRVFLLLSDRQDADQLARDLDAKGWSCAIESEQYNRVVTQIQDCRPVAAIIDVSQAPDRGIAVAAAVRSNPATRTMPIVFISASRVVDQVKAAVSDAIFASCGALDYLLGELAGR